MQTNNRTLNTLAAVQAANRSRMGRCLIAGRYEADLVLAGVLAAFRAAQGN